jgi:peptidyl-prolyl cis-trans isomerase C
MSVVTLFSLTLLIFTVGVWGQTVQPPAQKAEAVPAADADHAKEVLAKMGERVVTVGQIEAEFARIPPQFVSHFNDPQRKKDYVQNMVDRMVFAEEAKAKGYLDREDIKEKINSYVERILYTEYLKVSTEGLEVSAEEARQYYEANKNEFLTAERIRARHILVRTEEEANTVKAELDKGADWDELAKKYSTDKSNAERGGDLGFFSRGRMVKEFEDVAFAMNPGEIKGPVKTQFGYHIIKLEEKQAAQTQDFAQAEKAVKNKLATQKREARLAEIRDELFAKYKVTVNWDKVDDIKVGTGIAPAGRPGTSPMPMPMGQRPRTAVPAEQPPAKK